MTVSDLDTSDGEVTADLTRAGGYAGTTTGRRTSTPATRLSNMLAATTMLLGVRLDKMLKLTLLRGGPAQELLPGRELLPRG